MDEMVQGVKKNEKIIEDYLLSVFKITSEKNGYQCHTLHELILLVSYSPEHIIPKKRYL